MKTGRTCYLDESHPGSDSDQDHHLLRLMSLPEDLPSQQTAPSDAASCHSNFYISGTCIKNHFWLEERVRRYQQCTHTCWVTTVREAFSFSYGTKPNSKLWLPHQYYRTFKYQNWQFLWFSESSEWIVGIDILKSISQWTSKIKKW